MKIPKLKLLMIPVALMALSLAGCNNQTYTISFCLSDGTVLQSSTYSKNEMPSYNGETPTKAEDNTAKYTFKGWDKEIRPATSSVTYYAEFDVQNKYLIRFLDFEEKDIVEPQHVLDGEMPVVPTDVTREDVGETHYDFTGWDKTVVPATEATNYYAQYSSVHTCLVQFVSPEGEVYQSSRFPEGSMPVFYDGVPYMPDDKETKTAYEFIRWDKELVPVTADVTYTAIFREVESKTDWTAVEKSYLNYCLYQLPFYKARFEIKTYANDGLFYLESGRECDFNDYCDYCDLIGDITNDELVQQLIAEGYPEEILARIGKFAFDEEVNDI